MTTPEYGEPFTPLSGQGEGEKDERFDLALADCCRRTRNGDSLESCLADYPVVFREELARLVPVAAQLSRLSSDPSPEFRTKLEQRLRVSASEMRRASRGGLKDRIGRRFASFPAGRLAAAALVILVLLAASGVGVIQAADNSLPDSPLYQVKAAREWAELTLAHNEDARMVVQARQLNERARELEMAIKMNKPRRVVQALGAGLAATSTRLVDLALQQKNRGNPEPSNRALAAVQVARRYLDRLEAEAPPSYRPAIERLRDFLDRQEQRLSRGSAAASSVALPYLSQATR